MVLISGRGDVNTSSFFFLIAALSSSYHSWEYVGIIAQFTTGIEHRKCGGRFIYVTQSETYQTF